MTENTLNQNTKYVDELIDAVEPDFNFSDKPLNRFKILEKSYKNAAQNKLEKLLALKKKINSIENCKLKENSKKFNIIVGMYHDQVLTPLKTLFEYDAINITIGLPFLRVSPDHGPNEKMLGKNKSNPLSLIKAISFLDKN